MQRTLRPSAPTNTSVTASDGWTFHVDVVCVGADLRVRCSTARRVTLCRDARLVSSGRASVPEPAVTFDTTDAQTERPYTGLLVSL